MLTISISRQLAKKWQTNSTIQWAIYTPKWSLKLKNRKQHLTASHYHYSISKSPSPKMAKAPSSFKRNHPRNHYSYTTNQLYPRNLRSTSFVMSWNVLRTDAQHKRKPQRPPNHVSWHPPSERISWEQYRPNKAPTEPSKRLKIPYISERLNHKITSIFRKEGIPVRAARKSYTLRRALSHNTTERTCTRDNCTISNTKLCLCWANSLDAFHHSIHLSSDLSFPIRCTMASI